MSETGFVCHGFAVVPKRHFSSTKSPKTSIPSMAVASPPRPPPQHPTGRPPLPSPAPEGWCEGIRGRKELAAALAAADNALVVVVFVANWCRTCKTLLSKVARLAAVHPEIRFLKVDFAELENKPLCESLNVKLLPTFHLYKGTADPTDHVDGFTAGPFGLRRLVERLELQGVKCRYTGR